MTEPETIKDAIRACTTREQVRAVPDKYRADVQAMAKDPETRVMAIQIANLKIITLEWMK